MQFYKQCGLVEGLSRISGPVNFIKDAKEVELVGPGVGVFSNRRLQCP